jgi:hypothetical protein
MIVSLIGSSRIIPVGFSRGSWANVSPMAPPNTRSPKRSAKKSASLPQPVISHHNLGQSGLDGAR